MCVDGGALGYTRPVLRNILLAALLGGVAAAGPRPPLVHNADGSIQVGDHSYPSQQAFFASSECKESGGRCGTHTPAELSLIVPPPGSRDCGKSLTVITPAYSDG